ncbi:MAG: RIO1 family regulatory kinase/ATPase domain-containing protein [Methanoculleaceae archaeon]
MAVSPENVRSLQRSDLLVLHKLERLMKSHRWVPSDVLREATGLQGGDLRYRLDRLISMDMVRYHRAPYDGYALTFCGEDSIALHALSKRGTVHALGPLLGVGKESEVYEAEGLGFMVLKFHRVGQRSFQTPRRSRGYMPAGGHCPWIFASIHSAAREFEALRLLHPRVRVPLPVDRNRNAVAMSRINGDTLNRCRVDVPEEILDGILEQVAGAYRLGVIHGDLSEFNVMLDEDGRVWLIDWPQWVDTGHPNAEELLRHDIGQILRYFRRKFRVRRDPDEVFAGVCG